MKLITTTRSRSYGLLVCLGLLVLMASPGWSHGGEGHGGLDKAILKKLFPTADKFVTKPLNLSSEQRKAIEKRLGAKLEGHDLEAPAYVASLKGRSLGVVWATDAHLKEGAVDVIVGVDLAGKVTGVVLNHSKVPGLNMPAYLDQYKKLTTQSSFQEGKDLKPLAGQEASSKVVAAAVRKGVAIINESFLNKK